MGRTISTIVCAVLFFALFEGDGGIAWAGSGGSAYSILGIGDLRYIPGVRGDGMGYTGIGLASPDYINGLNPAGWSRINRTRLEANMLYEGFQSTDGLRSRFLARADFNGALLAIPISQTYGITMVAGFTPYSNVNYNTYTPGLYQTSTDTMNYIIDHVGTGGITKGQFGLSYAPSQDLSFGISLDYLFGSVDNVTSLTPTKAAYAGGRSTQTVKSNAVTLTLGGLFSGFGSFSKALQPLSLGVVVTSRGIMHTSRQNTFQFIQDGAETVAERDTTPEVSGRMSVPFAIGIGLAYRAGPRYILAADYYAQAWGSSEVDGVTPYGIRNMYRIGVGGERVPGKEFSTPWLDRIAYRLGAYYNATYYYINGHGINEWGLTAGLGLPLSGETRLNVGLEYGGRGVVTNSLIKDKILRLSFSLNISELWFIRYEED